MSEIEPIRAELEGHRSTFATPYSAYEPDWRSVARSVADLAGAQRGPDRRLPAEHRRTPGRGPGARARGEPAVGDLGAVRAGRVFVAGDAWGLGADVRAATLILDGLERWLAG